MKTILVPTTFSIATRVALKQALLFSKECHSRCKIILLNTYLLPHCPPSQLLTMHDELKNLSRQKLNEELKAVEHENLQGSYEVSLEPVCCMGSMENVICNLAQERKVDYVFLGVGNGGPQESLLKVVGRVSCPVMLVAPPSQQ